MSDLRSSSKRNDLPRLAPRPADAHKGHFGLALLIGGSRGMAGAIGLAGMSALRAGAGLVRLAVPDVCLDTVAAFDPAYMTVPLESDRRGRIALDALTPAVELARRATAIGLGPGMGRSLGLDVLVGRLHTELRQPMVVDADALNALAARPELLARSAGVRILTPHPGEFGRLIGGTPVPPERRQAAAVELAETIGAIVVLKGHQTCVTDGRRIWTNTNGNPGMASGGSGDVLTGLIVALVCQGLDGFDAARLGVYLHGLAGDLAAEQLGQESLTAGDLVRFLPAAFQQHSHDV